MFYTYILLLANGKYYTGQTNNVQNRLARHQTGQVQSTKALRPLKLVYFEIFASRKDSMARESYLKKLKSHDALTKIIHSGDGLIV